MEQDMAMLKQLHEAAARGEEKARAELDRVKRELAELREKPVEVAHTLPPAVKQKQGPFVKRALSDIIYRFAKPWIPHQ